MSTTVENQKEVPRGNLEGFTKYLKYDLISGLLVFLIALPLCLGISIASGYPAIAGIFTAIIGSFVATFLSDSELTIKGPAAGLIVIAIGCIGAFGGDGMVGGWTEADTAAYQAALAVGVAAAILQICFGFFRAGILGEFFPISAVHGMLAAIGVIIIAKQIPVALGVSASGGPLELLKQIPHFIADANPAIAAIGVVSVLIMFLWPFAQQKAEFLKVLPSPLIVLIVAIPMGMGFDLMHKHSYVLQNHEYQLGENYLVTMPDRVFGMFDELTHPNFAALREPRAWPWVLMFFIIGSLESLLSAKAIDLLDPWKRKSNMDRDMVAVGAGNLCCALVGGLPMISEIVRSKANIDNGARTRFADLWHGVFLLVCVALIPMVLHRIPMAALAAMLIYTGFRLAHPKEFMNVWKIGREQLVIFVVTLVSVLATDLLIGIAIGIATKVVIHISNGVPVRSLFKPEIELTEDDGNTVRLTARQSAVFSNWIPMRRQIERIGLVDRRNVVLDLSDVQLIDHTVMDKLHEVESDFEQQGLSFTTVGLESHQAFTEHAHSARRKGVFSAKLFTITTDPSIEEILQTAFVRLGVSGYTSFPCSGAGRHEINSEGGQSKPRIRFEVIVTKEQSQTIVDYLAREVQPDHRLTFTVENVQVARIDAFTPNVDSSVLKKSQTAAELVKS
ncbi:SulP family inorganic anion transporter [Aporhodopirellula aestuarii]|uniref:SulP family inorganic anion transporter n=1 Tax=Aporhodopirellula aestuarii TaxID=2950107 RepID=A0ABT0TXP3_9BACT|nr:SulP family inorganic anion transporter [Aporhodopirellula aestuarii]MCM2369358.1 SulP family inorganic anion transporter [Aporhodopirellula aestuarii]